MFKLTKDGVVVEVGGRAYIGELYILHKRLYPNSEILVDYIQMMW